ncbi:sigma-70 family RNA polymerase sigma factor [Actinacidiphila acididurans]|uniref:sigma-70 family RNA polymerase sigma factor n=1 Tax=Actinacidiphila acididurans TaxID=2784346 RepID=UPI0027DC291A|nr:sigma-70 family RNA polymerase sigma factor [Actinacidiphila acididurans]
MASSPWRVRRRPAPSGQREPWSLRDEDDVQDAWDRYGGELFGFVLKALGDRQLAEDVVQEVFVRAWQSFDPARASLRTWLFAIARNAVADALRQRAARRTVHRDGPDGEDPADGEPEPDPMDRLLERIQLEAALERLSPEHRQAVTGVHFGGRTCAELGRELGIPASTMRSRLYYGMRTLRLVLEENGWLAP